MPSKFTELLDNTYQTSEYDVRLEDIVEASSFNGSRSRTSSEASSASNSSSENLSSSSNDHATKKNKRMSRILTFGRG